MLVPLVAVVGLAVGAAEPEIAGLARELGPSLVAVRRDLHAHPELANRKFRTGKRVAERLRILGLEVKYPVAKTGVVGVLRGALPGRTVVVRADMDALPIEERRELPYRSRNPGVMHACGHDAHTAIALRASRRCSRACAGGWRGWWCSSSSRPRRVRRTARRAVPS